LASLSAQTDMDLKEALTEKRFVGIWRLLKGYQWIYIGAILGVGVAAIARTATYLLLGYYVDEVLINETSPYTPLQIALGFIALSLVMGVFAFVSGTLAGRTSEGVAKRVRDYIFDHIQHLTFTYHDQTKTGELIQRSTSDIDAIRRFYADQAIGVGRISLLFLVNFIAMLFLEWRLALISVIVVPFTITRRRALQPFTGESGRCAGRKSVCSPIIRDRQIRNRKLGKIPAGKALVIDAFQLLAHF